MKLFSCQTCGNILYFENRICGQCGQRLGYVPETQTLTALEEEDPGSAQQAAARDDPCA